jgi:osmoprotectant transport system ATP-binding protein
MLMDEPFGAIDPINRERLQNEFLRLQSELRKTVVFVTHDIDEAIKMGDRIAIMREGGELVQYDTPARILAHPSDEFVAQFVGADRGLKRLALTTLREIELEPVGSATAESGTAQSIGIRATLRDALSLMMSDSLRPLLVVDGERPAGYVSIELINRVLRDGADTAADSDGPDLAKSSVSR